MKNIDDILVRLNDPANMEFCGDLSNIQSIMNYANESIRPLARIRYRGGNEEYISRIVAKLIEALKAKGYIDSETEKPVAEHSVQLRKITFFLVLNTDSSYKYDLMTDHTISHLLNAFPQMTKCLLMACVWGLSLDQYLYECIAYTPIWFAFAFIEESVESLKYADPYETLDRVDNLVRAIYTNIARSDHRSMENVEKKIILNKYFDVTMELLRHFFSPDASGFDTWPNRKKYKYSGYALKHNLELVLHCFELYLHKPCVKYPNHNIYSLMREREPLVDNMRERYSDPVDDTLHRLNMVILNSLQNIVMSIDCNAFMYWVEIDFDAETTLQQLVGEAAYRAEQLINTNECFDHDVSTQLKAIAIKPLTIQERAQQCTIGELIEKLEQLQDGDEHIGLWLQEFISRGELVLGNTECLEALELHARNLSVTNLRRLIEFAATVDIENGFAVEEKLVECCLIAFDHLSENAIVDLIHYSVEQQQQHFSYLQLDNYDSLLIEVFNRTTFTHDRKLYLKLLFQNPQLCYDKLFHEALNAEVQMLQAIEILRTTKQIFKPFLETYLKLLIEKYQPKDRLVAPLIPKLIAQLFHLDVVEPNVFIIDNLYKKYYIPALQSKDLSRLALIVNTLLLTIQQKYSFDGFAPPIVVMGAQIIEQCRWTVITFDEMRVSLVTKTIEFIQEMLKRFLPTATDKDKTWIQSKIQQYHPLTKYYFQKLSLEKGQPIERFVDFIRPASSSSNSCDRSGTKFLCEIIVRCTAKEIKWLADSDDLLPHFHHAIRLVATIIVRSKNQPETDCLRYCCNSYFGIVEAKLLPRAETPEARTGLFVEILTALKPTHLLLSLYNELLINCHPLLSTMLEQCVSSETARARIQAEINQLTDCEGKTLISQKFNSVSADKDADGNA